MYSVFLLTGLSNQGRYQFWACGKDERCENACKV